MAHAARQLDVAAIGARARALAGCVERMAAELAELQVLIGETAGTSQADGAPLATWLDVAAAVGIDDSTIRAHRRRTRDPQRPFFGSAAEARSWYAQLVAKPAFVPSPSKKRCPQVKGGVVDWGTVVV